MVIELRRHLDLLVAYLGPQRLRVLGLALLLLAGIGLQLANPQVIRSFVDTTQTGGSQRALVTAAVLYIAIALVGRIMSLAAVYVGETVSWGATNALRADLTRHCLDLDLPFHKEHTPGELIERIDGDVTKLGNFFSEFVIRVLGNALLVLGILVVLYRYNWLMGVGLTCYILLTFATLRAVQRRAVSRWVEARQASAEHYGYLEERITGTEDVRANGAEAYVLQRLHCLTHALLVTTRRARLVGNVTFISTNFLSVLGYALGLGVGAYLYRHGQASIGTAYSIVFYIGMLAAPLETIRDQIQDLQQATASIGRIDALLHLQPQVQDGRQDGGARAGSPSGTPALEFDHVSFAYDGTHDILHDIDLRLAPCQVLGLLGRTGSGKTTLTRLLFRLYDPTAGAIRLEGVDLRALPLSDLRSRVGMVTQDVQLFGASVRDNLTFFRAGVSDDRILSVVEELGLSSWYRSLPHGLDTVLAAGEQGLSAGEAQLLAFVRVFLKDPGLVILDEASSRLDPATEQLVERAVDRLLAGRTAIVVAHRLRTVQRADAIMILDGGRIAEYGARARLAADPASRFHHLLHTGLEVPVA